VRLVVENCFHFPKKTFLGNEVEFRFQFSMKFFENAFG